jgi:hypothetical protein
VPNSRLHIELHVTGTYWKWSNLFGEKILGEIPPQDYIVDPDHPQRHPTLAQSDFTGQGFRF